MLASALLLLVGMNALDVCFFDALVSVSLKTRACYVKIVGPHVEYDCAELKEPVLSHESLSCDAILTAPGS